MHKQETARNKRSWRSGEVKHNKINLLLNDSAIIGGLGKWDTELLMLRGLSLIFMTVHTLLLHLLAETSSLISVPDLTGKKTYCRRHRPSSLFLPSEINRGAEVMVGRTHGVAAGWVQHSSWSTEQAEELGAPPLLCWQVPAWVDHPQRQQRRRHRLGEGTEKGRKKQ